ncbi:MULTISPECIES: hypothetical protein [Nostoc]|jgi:hypothetical protein|uniref:Uncharacterized protein n=1 Tax=Nostoc punctiforme (strain ATCC 29133 / PCC 73102) TaxID=63737 RepID=B2J1M3_NOSP7|nr:MULTISPECIES: hypothetical protein [Nostoc]ACC80384.1 hypothetical protein Npun_F1713 [Nostoc punctiforme PCC 73102]MBE8986096.1 hypothetical protein [Nostoc sp. LEGE 12450]NEU81014.1 hypothetical protein [Nostoc sp. UIC 10630]
MNPETLQQLKDEVQQKLLESVNNASLYSVLEKYGVPDARALTVQWQFNIDPNKIKSGDAVDEQEILVVQDSWCVPCPTGNPLGCNC